MPKFFRHKENLKFEHKQVRMGQNLKQNKLEKNKKLIYLKMILNLSNYFWL